MLDLTFGLSFKVKRWFTGFGELSFRWIQICISSLMRRSSLYIDEPNKDVGPYSGTFLFLGKSYSKIFLVCIF